MQANSTLHQEIFCVKSTVHRAHRRIRRIGVTEGSTLLERRVNVLSGESCMFCLLTGLGLERSEQREGLPGVLRGETRRNGSERAGQREQEERKADDKVGAGDRGAEATVRSGSHGHHAVRDGQTRD